jgi:hypothetical protein
LQSPARSARSPISSGRFSDGAIIYAGIAGVYTLSELDDELRERTMLMEKVGRGCTFEDAETLAKYAGHRPDPTRQDNDFNKFVAEAMA